MLLINSKIEKKAEIIVSENSLASEWKILFLFFIHFFYEGNKESEN